MAMICRRRWLESQRRHTEAARVDPCGTCDTCRGRAPQPARGDRSPRRHMTCRYHWLVSKRREPDVAPCGHCQQCEAHSPDQPSETPVESEGVVTSEEFPVPQAEPTEPTRDEVIAGLEDLGVKVDKRWGDKRLLDEYEQARLAAQAV